MSLGTPAVMKPPKPLEAVQPPPPLAPLAPATVVPGGQPSNMGGFGGTYLSPLGKVTPKTTASKTLLGQ